MVNAHPPLGINLGMWSLGVLGGVQARAALIATLKATGVWQKGTALWLFKSDTQANALTDIISGLTLTAANSPAWGANTGFTGDGVSAHLIGDTYANWFTPNGFAQNNASVFVWNGNNNTTAGGGALIGTDAAGPTILFNPAHSGDYLAEMRANDTTSDLLPSKSGVVAMGFSRSASGSYTAFINNQKTKVSTASGVIDTTHHLTFLRANTAYSQNQVLAAWIGLPLTDAQSIILLDAVDRYLGSSFDTSGFGLDGAWSWFNGPSGVIIDGVTYVCPITAGGSLVVGAEVPNV